MVGSVRGEHHGRRYVPQAEVPPGRHGQDMSDLVGYMSGIKEDKIISRIESVTDTGIQKILLVHLKKYDRLEFKSDNNAFEILINGRIQTYREKYSINDNDIKSIIDSSNNTFYYKGIEIHEEDIENADKRKNILSSHNLKITIKHYPDIAFSPDGIDNMNRNILELNGGKPHKPIYKVRHYESGNKYSIGQLQLHLILNENADRKARLYVLCLRFYRSYRYFRLPEIPFYLLSI